MQIQLDSQPYSSIHADALVTYVFDQDKKIEGVLSDIDEKMDGRLAALATAGELTGKALELVLVHFPEGLDAKRLLLVGAGKPGKFSVSDLRKIAGAALRHLKSRGVKKFIFLAREGERGSAAAQAVTEGLITADFESDTSTAPTRRIIATSSPFRSPASIPRKTEVWPTPWITAA